MSLVQRKYEAFQGHHEPEHDVHNNSVRKSKIPKGTVLQRNRRANRINTVSDEIIVIIIIIIIIINNNNNNDNNMNNNNNNIKIITIIILNKIKRIILSHQT